MKKFIAILLLSLTSSLYALPSCPSDKNQIYDNCFGTETFDNGNYVGEWKDNKMHGQGTYTYTNGDKFVGKYKDDKRHGRGIFTTANGYKYVGEFKDNKRHGQGTYTFPDGVKKSGYWKNDTFLPDICEGMGLSEDTSEFEQCVLKLIDKL